MDRIVGIIDKSKNPSWPPKSGSIIAVQKGPVDKIYIGRVYAKLLTVNAIVITLLNDRLYVDKFIKETAKSLNSIGHMTVLPTYGWRYVNPKKMLDVMNKQSPDDLYKEVIHKFGEAFKSVPEKEERSTCIKDDDELDTSLLTQKGEIQLNNLFKDTEVNELFRSDDVFTPPNEEVIDLLMKKLNTHEAIEETDMKLIVNKTVAVKNMIDNKDDEINEGNKIMKWLIENMINVESDELRIFSDIKLALFNGYVHITRKGLNVNDIISEHLIPDLKVFKWQYGRPIDYDTLKYVLFQTDSQSELERDGLAKSEAEKVLSQEFLIAMQPEPKYQMWTLKRVLMCWYADVDLQNNIRKIKVLINQWRARGDKKFNRVNGVLPSIVIYPRYGKNSARIVLTKLANMFVLYQNIGWKCSKPTYFKKVNDLIWYTNGNIDLKLYFRTMKKEFDKSVKNRSFTDNYDKLKITEDLTYQPK
jgi:hypothetical protein